MGVDKRVDLHRDGDSTSMFCKIGIPLLISTYFHSGASHAQNDKNDYDGKTNAYLAGLYWRSAFQKTVINLL